jgi:hypothetical protein
MSDHVDDLIDRGLFQRGEDLITFASSLALLNIQNMLNQWVAPTRSWIFGKKVVNAYDNPISTFRAYARDRVSSKDRSHLESALKLMGDTNYLEAKKALDVGLDNISLVTFTRSLVCAATYYFIARLVAQVIEENNLSVCLVYGAVQTEEGFACTGVGLLEPVSFLFKDAVDLPREVVNLVDSRKSVAEIAFGFCSTVWPRFTKKFFKVLVATGRILRPGESLDRGIRDLLALQVDYDDALGTANVAFERGWIDLALMSAYMIRGNEEAATRYAQKLAIYFALRGDLRNAGETGGPDGT